MNKSEKFATQIGKTLSSTIYLYLENISTSTQNISTSTQNQIQPPRPHVRAIPKLRRCTADLSGFHPGQLVQVFLRVTCQYYSTNVPYWHLLRLPGSQELTASLNGHFYVLISGHKKANEWVFYCSQNNLQLRQKLYQKLPTRVPN